jgi:ribonuclease P protein component
LSKRFSKRMRILRTSEFERVFAARRSASDASIALYGLANQQGCPRVGLVVSRRVGGAVQRNRWKRLLREAFRHMKDQLPPLDIVCVVRVQSPPSLGELQRAILQLAQRIEIQPEKPRCTSMGTES